MSKDILTERLLREILITTIRNRPNERYKPCVIDEIVEEFKGTIGDKEQISRIRAALIEGRIA